MNEKVDELEALLRQNQSFQEDNAILEEMPKKIEVPPLTSDRNASVEDFIEMVSKVVSKGLYDEKVEFLMDEGDRIVKEVNEPVDHPCITYFVIERVPKLEIKPREREHFIKENTFIQSDARQGRIYGQKFTAKIQFNIFASEYKVANRVMNIFEDLIFNYKYYFKKNGVAEILFHKQITDQNFDIYRQNMSVRNLIYEIEVEKLYVIFDSEIAQIDVK